MIQISHRLMIFSGSGHYSILGDRGLVETYETWLNLTCEPAEKKFEVKGHEDGSGHVTIRLCLLWEEVKGMQLDEL